jgi:hypothetical protein
MGLIPRVIAVALLISSCAAPAMYRQSWTLGPGDVIPSGKAIVILAADFREQTSFRDNISQSGNVFFRKLDETYQALPNDHYDFGIEYSVGADWRANLGSSDDNRAPHLFAIEPGKYVIEKITIGSSPKTIMPGYDPRADRANYGIFSVRSGEVVNLGRLVVHMHFYDGYFSAKVEEDADEVRQLLSKSHPTFEAKLQARSIQVNPQFAFHQ